MEIRERWQALVLGTVPPARTDAIGPRVHRLFQRLDEAYSEAGRAYHTWQHVGECLDLLDRYAAATGLGRPDAHRLEYALFYHDVVYRPGLPDNEEESARVAGEELAGLLPPEEIDAVSRLILATEHLAGDQQAGRHRLAPAMVDVDLAILGATRERFLEYDAQIRVEYAYLAPDRFRAGRRRVLESLAARPRVYATAYFFERFESRARDNIAHALAKFYSRRQPG